MAKKFTNANKSYANKFIKKVSFQYCGVDDNGMEYGEYFEFPDLLTLNSQLNKVLCRSDKSLTLRSVAFYINGSLV